MSASSDVVSLVASFAGRSTSSVRSDSTLAGLGLSSSLRLTRLQRALEARVGFKGATIDARWTVGQIVSANGGEVSELRASSPATAQPGTSFAIGSLSVGVDIQDIAAMPDAANWREHEFYALTFSPNELAYAMLSPFPRQRLCGMFCAKEAVRKCASELAGVPFLDIEIGRHGDAPTVRLADEGLRAAFEFRVSISHTDHVAMATVIAMTR